MSKIVLVFLLFATMIVLLLVTGVGSNFFFHMFGEEQEHEQPRWHCDKIDCGNTILKNVEFDGSLLYWNLKNCRVQGCYEINSSDLVEEMWGK